jgi:hypothetical protein
MCAARQQAAQQIKQGPQRRGPSLVRACHNAAPVTFTTFVPSSALSLRQMAR